MATPKTDTLPLPTVPTIATLTEHVERTFACFNCGALRFRFEQHGTMTARATSSAMVEYDGRVTQSEAICTGCGRHYDVEALT